jgi:hypothetical protein
MWNDKEVTLNNFYEMPRPSAKSLRQREEKVKEIIANLGAKYCLYKSVERKDAGL